MKLTDLALVFLGVTLPIIIVVYINVSFNIKAMEQEMYYKKLIDTAISSATESMKQVENTDKEIDYGYSGTEDKKVSVNAQVAVDTFFDSLYNNFNIKGNSSAEHYLQMFVPVVAIIDYNGVQISSIEQFKKKENGNEQTVIEHVLKPKTYYTYSYSIYKQNSTYKMIGEGEGESALDGYELVSAHTVEFTMDDYITHRGSTYKSGGTVVKNELTVKGFYISDSNNNSDLVGGISNSSLKRKVVNKLTEIRKQIIVNTIEEQLAYAVNRHNSYARSAGITYNFTFPATTEEELSDSVDNVGILAFVQGLSVGNKYLNTKAYGVSRLELVTRYYFSVPNENSKYKMNLYHKDANCPEYLRSTHNGVTPTYVTSKQQAASARISMAGQILQGFYPCPVCNP